MSYVEGFVNAVPSKNKDIYINYVKEAAVIFKEHGATKLVECWGDDIPSGKITSFPMAVKCKDDETVCFSWMFWASKDARDKGMKKIMDDPRLHPDKKPMPFDGERMIFGGFEIIVDE